jgi:hypothetical protein
MSLVRDGHQIPSDGLVGDIQTAAGPVRPNRTTTGAVLGADIPIQPQRRVS